MQLRKYLFSALLSLVGCFICMSASAGYVYSENCRKAYNAFFSLDMDEGRQYIALEQKLHPDNQLADYIADYEDMIWMLFNGNNAALEKRKAHLDERLEKIEQGDHNTPWYRFCKAGLYLHWAAINGRGGHQLRSAVMFRKSFLLLKENQKLYPSFAYNDVILGMEQAATGAVPENYQWVVSLLGIKGDISKGAEKITKFLKQEPDKRGFLYAEAQFYHIYIGYYLQYRQGQVWDYLTSTDFNTSDNLLNVFIKANLGVNSRHAAAALQELLSARSNPYWQSYPILEYELGAAQLHQLDGSCIAHLEQFVKASKNNFFIKDALQKEALMYYLQANTTKANECLARITHTGSLETDADKHAQRFSEAKVFPNKTLLKAQLLCDGGYYKRAETEINAIDISSLNEVEKIEHSFRQGRIYDELGEDNKALQCYQKTIAMGNGRKEYYAARAALQMAFIYEQYHKKAEAVARYKECLAMKGHDYQSSIDQQAKAGLNRLEGD